MEEFVVEAEPIVNDLKAMTKDIEEKLKELILYYGEDPISIKSEEFFDIISTFSNSFEVRSF
jgi:predicted nucleotidyltransferase